MSKHKMSKYNNIEAQEEIYNSIENKEIQKYCVGRNLEIMSNKIDQFDKIGECLIATGIGFSRYYEYQDSLEFNKN